MTLFAEPPYVIRAATFRCHPPKSRQLVNRNRPQSRPELTADEKAALELEKERALGRASFDVVVGGLFMLYRAMPLPVSCSISLFLFCPACWLPVIWNVSHALHTPLMAVTNAISGIIIIGALLQLDRQTIW